VFALYRVPAVKVFFLFLVAGIIIFVYLVSVFDRTLNTSLIE